MARVVMGVCHTTWSVKIQQRYWMEGFRRVFYLLHKHFQMHPVLFLREKMRFLVPMLKERKKASEDVAVDSE